MHAWWMNVTENEAKLELRDAPRPQPGPGQLLVRVRAAGLNRGEFIIGGLVKPGTSKALGIEAAGEVVEAGTGCRRFQPGARVMGRFPGGLAEFVLANEAEAMPVPAVPVRPARPIRKPAPASISAYPACPRPSPWTRAGSWWPSMPGR